MRLLRSKIIGIAVLYNVWLICAVSISVLILGEERLLLYANEVKPYSEILRKDQMTAPLEGAGAKKVICFGDSNFFSPPKEGGEPYEDLSWHITGLLRDALKARNSPEQFHFVEWAYRGAGAFDYYCLFHRAASLSPDLVIIPINWRAFSRKWIENDNWFHPELSAFVPFVSALSSAKRDIFRQRGISFGDYTSLKFSFLSLYPIGIKHWILDWIYATGKAQQPESKVVNERESIFFGAQLMGNMFPMRLEDSNLTLTELGILAETASKSKIDTLFFIWPLDREYFSTIGILDEGALAQSKRKLGGLMNRPYVHFVDLSDLLEHEFFFDSYGHCTVEGRQRIADALSPKAIEILNTQRAASGP